MATEVKAYRANDGTLHEDICAAATRDVEIIVEGSPLSENQPYARQLVEWLCGNATLIRQTLGAHEMACPKALPAEVVQEGHFKWCQSHGDAGLPCDCRDTEEDVRGEIAHHGC